MVISVDRDELDPVAILGAVGMPAPGRVDQVRGGADAAIWRVEVGGDVYALRVLWPVQAGQAAREVAAMRAAGDGGVPVPAIVAEGDWRGRPATVMTWAPGRTLAEELLATYQELDHARALGTDLGRVQAAIHALPVTPELGTHPESWLDWAGTDALDAGLWERLGAVEGWPDAVIHLDLHPLNVLVAGERVTAVLDWANQRIGDPRADVARTLSILRLAPLPAEADEAAVRAALAAFEASWLAAYEGEAGPVGGLALFCSWAGAVMERDLGRWIGKADLPWLTEGYLDVVRAWTAGWQQ